MNGLFPDLIPGKAPVRRPIRTATCPKCTGWGEVSVVDPGDGVIWNAECPYCDATGKVTAECKAAFNETQHGPVGYDCEDSKARALRAYRRATP